MNWQLVISLTTLGTSLLGALILYSWRGGAWSGTERRKVDELRNQLEEHKRDMDRRFTVAGKATSDAWSYVQGMESKILRDFAARDVTDERFLENRRDHERFDKDIARLYSNGNKRT